MSTKYIINNLSDQTITGNLNVSGNFNYTGTTNDLANYKALLTQTESLSGASIGNFNGALIIGETYTITNFVSGDSFANIANVQSGNVDETNCVFIATGETPFLWNNGSELVSSGNLVVSVIENNLGYDMIWEQIAPGNYFAIPSNIGPKYNNFPRNNTSVLTQKTISAPPFDVQYVSYYAMPASFLDKDDIIFLYTWNSDIQDSVANTLYYTPIEIKIKLDTDITPVTLSGSVIASYPFGYASINLFCNGTSVETFIGDDTVVNTIDELVNELNANEQTKFLGTYTFDEFNNVLLTIPTNLVNRFCSNGNLTFEVFND